MASVMEESATERAGRPPASPPPIAPLPPQRPRRRVVLIGIVALVAVAGLIWGARAWLYARSHASTDDAQVDGHIIPVLAKVGGYVTAVPVNENDSVREGQVLVRLDSAEYSVRLEQAEADLAAARAAAGGLGTTGQAEAQVLTAAGERASLDAQIAAARAASDRAQSDLGRMRELAAKQIVSQQQLDAAAAAASAAAANLRAAEEQAAAAGAGVTVARAGVRLAEARLQAATAARDNAALQLSYTNVTAPASGTVARRQVEVGQLVQPGQPLMAIVADTGTFVTANFKETQLASMRVGQPVTIQVDAYDACTALGVVESLSPATGAKFALLPPDNATGNFTKVVQRVPVRIRITRGCGAARPLRPGMSVTASVLTGA